MEAKHQASVKQFVQKFNDHYYKVHPSQIKPSKLLELVEQLTVFNFDKLKTPRVVVIDKIETLLNEKLECCKNTNKKHILIIGAAGVGKTAFMKYYANKSQKIAVYMNCVEIASVLKQQAQEAIDIIFEMINFQNNAILYLDEIDMLFNQEYQYEEITKGKNAIIRNLNNKQYKASVIFATNRPWKIQNHELLNQINYAIQIPLFNAFQRRQFILKLLEQTKDFKVQNAEENVNKLVNYTQNFTNSDIYCLIKTVPYERLKQMMEQANGNAQLIKDKQIVANEKHVQIAMTKVKSSFQLKQINSFTEWRKKFNKANLNKAKQI